MYNVISYVIFMIWDVLKVMLCHNILTNIVQGGVEVPTSDKPTLKMLICRAPIYPPKTGPTQNYCLSENLFIVFIFL